MVPTDTFAVNHHRTFATFVNALPMPTPTTLECPLCPSLVALSEPLLYAFCPTCSTTTHLTCLSAHFLRGAKDTSSVLPTWGTCAGLCGWEGEWGQVIRGCWSVKRGIEETLDVGRKKGRAGKRKADQQANEDDDNERTDEDEPGFPQDREDEPARSASPPFDRSLEHMLSTVAIKTPPKKHRIDPESPQKGQGGPSQRSRVTVESLPRPSSRPPPSKPRTKAVTKSKMSVDEYVDIDDDDGEESEGVIFERMMGLK